MSAVPNAVALADWAYIDALAELRDEFLGWTITAGPDDSPWRAFRAAGHSDPLTLSADSGGELRALLDQADAVDCRRAIVALCDALRGHGAEAEVHGLTVSTKTRAGILRTVTARRGTFTWTTGVNVGPIGDPQAAAARITRGLGLETRPEARP